MKKKLMACAAFWLPTLALTGCGSQFGDKMVRAGMNTLMGMGTVFVVLIFIAFLISRFKYISQLENWFRNRKTKNEQAVTETVAEEPAATQLKIRRMSRPGYCSVSGGKTQREKIAAFTPCEDAG